MKAYAKELHFEIPDRRAFINITADVENCLAESGIKEGLLRAWAGNKRREKQVNYNV